MAFEFINKLPTPAEIKVPASGGIRSTQGRAR